MFACVSDQMMLDSHCLTAFYSHKLDSAKTKPATPFLFLPLLRDDSALFFSVCEGKEKDNRWWK